MAVQYSAISFRSLTLEDAECYRQMMSDPDIVRFAATIPQNPSLSWAEKRIKEKNFGSSPEGPQEFGLFAVCDGKEHLVANALWFWTTHHKPEIGYAVHQDHRGNGLAQKALNFIINHVRNELDYAGAIFGGVAKENSTSIYILEKAGFLRRNEWRHFSIGRNADVELWVYTYESL